MHCRSFSFKPIKKVHLWTGGMANSRNRHWVTVRTDMLADPCAVQLPKDLPPICAIKNISFYAPQDPSEHYLSTTFKLFEDMGLAELLFHHILPETLDSPTIGSEAMIAAVVSYTFDWSRRPSQSWIKELKKFPVVPIKSLDAKQPQQYRRLEAIVDPKSNLAKLYFESEDVWPKAEFLQQHYHALEACGIPSKVTGNIAVERARFYSGCNDAQQVLPKVCNLLAMAVDFSMPSLTSSVREIVNLPWLPVRKYHEQSLTLLPPSQCRGGDEGALVNYVLGTFESTVTKSWRNLYVLLPRFC